MPMVDLEKETENLEASGIYSQASNFEKTVLFIAIILIAIILSIALCSGIILMMGVEDCGGPLKVLCDQFLTKLV